MDSHSFTRRIEDLGLSLRALDQNQSEDRTIAALAVAVEELRVAGEELRRQNEELLAARGAVAAEQQRYRDLFEFAPDGYLVTDAAGIIREANRAAAVLLGVRAELLAGKPLAVFIPRAERRAFRTTLNRLRAGDHPPESEVRLKPRHRAPFDAALTLAPVRDRDRTTVALRWLVRDISERKRAEAEQARLQRLAEAAATYQSLVDSTPDAVVVHDLHGRIVLVNRQAEVLFGYEHDELTGRIMEVLMPERFHEVHARHRAGYASSPHIRPMGSGLDHRARRKDGSEFMVDISLSAAQWNGEPIIISAIRDVTERRRAEEGQRFLDRASTVLASSLDYTRTLTAVAELAVPHLADWCAVDVVDETNGIRGLAMVAVDPRKTKRVAELRRLHPFGPDATDGVVRVIRTGEPELVPEVTDELLAAASVDAEHLRLLRGLGMRSLLRVPLMARGTTIGAISLVLAESDRRYGPDDLALAQELARRAGLAVDNAALYRQAQEALRVRDAFLSTITHDLGQPLTVIRMGAQVLRRDIRRLNIPNAGDVAERLDGIDSAVGRMAGMISELLDLARVQQGQQLVLNPRPIDLVALVRHEVETHQTTTALHRIGMETAAQELRGEWDPARMTRVVSNLIENAIKYSPSGGDITVTVKPAFEDGRDWADCSVRDEGIGIPAQDLPYITELFYRAGNVAGAIAGTGIGLAGARQIVEQHGGSLMVASEEGKGTTVTVRLPLRDERLPPTPIPEREGGSMDLA